MRVILQRVASASVEVAGETVGAIGKGLLLFVGVEKGDGPEQTRAAVEKLARLRIFEDDKGRMNLDAAVAGGEFLVVSQFTLAASLNKGRRPSFERAAPPAVAEPLVTAVAEGLRQRGFTVAEGSFGAHMEVRLLNDGPVTFVLDFAPSGDGEA
ncbi:MAG: D-aminoacyl-tRNA deacylase [Acidobacteriota bacterium]|nr:D-aminoacyl-tRNA deacylase [Acidobacteriota bacterium]